MNIANKIRIRKATTDDLEGAFPMIDQQNWYWTKPEVASVLEKGQHHSLVAMLGDDIAGILFALKNNGFATWTHLIVKEHYRNAGIGGQLIARNLEDLSRSGVKDFDIIAVSNKVGYYKNFDFNATEEILCYERAADQAMVYGSRPASACCRAVDLHDLKKTGALSMLESSTSCSLGQFTGGLVYNNTSPVIGLYEEEALKGIMVTHLAPNDIELGPWFIRDITIEKAKQMLVYASGLAENKNICLSISSKNQLAKDLVDSERFAFTERLTRMVRPEKAAQALNENLVSIGKF